MKKITKRENFEALREIVKFAAESDEAERLVAFIDKEIESLDKRAANAKKYASKKKAESDELMEIVNTVLNTHEGAMTIPQIVDVINAEYPDMQATPQKLTYRLNKLVEDGVVAKETVSIKSEGKPARRVNAYSAVAIEEEDVEE